MDLGLGGGGDLPWFENGDEFRLDGIQHFLADWGGGTSEVPSPEVPPREKNPGWYHNECDIYYRLISGGFNLYNCEKSMVNHGSAMVQTWLSHGTNMGFDHGQTKLNHVFEKWHLGQ